MTQAVSTEPKKIAETLRTIRSAGVTGDIAFDPKGARQTIVYVTAIVQDGQFRPHKKIGPDGNWFDAS